MRKLGGFEANDASLEPLPLALALPRVCEVAYESCVVGLERSCGRAGAMEWAVEGRELETPKCGRGGSGGGASSCDATELADVLRGKLRMMSSVGLAKSCDSIWPALVEVVEALLLFCVGVVGTLPCSSVGGRGSASPI